MRDAVFIGLLVASCGGQVQDDGSPTGGGAGGGGHAAGAGAAAGSGGTTASGATTGSGATGGTAGAGATGGSTSDAGGMPSCSEVALAIAKKAQIVGSCTAIVRFTQTTLTLLGHQWVCGTQAPPDEVAARATAQQDTGFGTGVLLSGPAPTDAWVFLVEPLDVGGAAVVSARNGLTLFGGGIVWGGKGDIIWPKIWLHDPLSEDCAPVTLPKVRSFDLGTGGQALAAAEIDKVLKRVSVMALPSGLAQIGNYDIVLLRYRRSVGPLDPSSDEYVVLFNSGWME